MRTKPQSHVRDWQWNNAWFLSQERPVKNIGFKTALEERNIPVSKPEDFLTPIYGESSPPERVDLVETSLGQLARDDTHPLWQSRPAYSFLERCWLPRNREVLTALAITNSVHVESLPDRITEKQVLTSESTSSRLETLIKNACIGDATQRLLPRNWKVPYIGWHPVESKMRQRNQYDWQAFSWGRRTPREYGILNIRKLSNLNRFLVKDIINSAGLAGKATYSVEPEVHRQFINDPDGNLIRLYFPVPLSVNSTSIITPFAGEDQFENYKEVPSRSVDPLSPLATLHPTNIYRNENNHPVTSLKHSHPYINTAFNFYTSHIAPQWRPEIQRAKCLIYAFNVAIGQARLRYGSEVEGRLPKPVNVNLITTDGPRYLLSSFQLNTLDLGSDVKNIFWCSPETLNLYEYCGYKDAKVVMEGLDIDTYKTLHSLVTDMA